MTSQSRSHIEYVIQTCAHF